MCFRLSSQYNNSLTYEECTIVCTALEYFIKAPMPDWDPAKKEKDNATAQELKKRLENGEYTLVVDEVRIVYCAVTLLSANLRQLIQAGVDVSTFVNDADRYLELGDSIIQKIRKQLQAIGLDIEDEQKKEQQQEG